MAQTAENYAFEGKYDEAIPVASIQISSGDAVMMTAAGAVQPVTANLDGHMKFCGISDDDWSATRAIQLYGATSTDFATPTTRPVKLKYYPDGIFNLAIRETSGTKGQSVYIQTATTGVQVFTIDPIAGESIGPPIGELYQNFTGAVANDRQRVRVRAVKTVPRDIRWLLMNHVIQYYVPTVCSKILANSADGATNVPTWGNIVALVNGVMVFVEQNCETGAACDNVDSNSAIVLYALNSAGSVVVYQDSAKWTATTRAAMLAGSAYWPSVTTDNLPIGIAFMQNTNSYISGPVFFVAKTLASALKVT